MRCYDCHGEFNLGTLAKPLDEGQSDWKWATRQTSGPGQGEGGPLRHDGSDPGTCSSDFEKVRVHRDRAKCRVLRRLIRGY